MALNISGAIRCKLAVKRRVGGSWTPRGQRSRPRLPTPKEPRSVPSASRCPLWIMNVDFPRKPSPSEVVCLWQDFRMCLSFAFTS